MRYPIKTNLLDKLRYLHQNLPKPQIGVSGRDRRAIVHQLRKARLSYRAVALPLTMPFDRQGRFYERSLHTPIRGLGAQ